MTEQIAMDGPFKIDVKVHITDGNGKTGVVTVGLANGEMPTAAKVRLAVKQAADAAGEAKMRLMNRHEFITELLDAGPIAVPGPKDFPSN